MQIRQRLFPALLASPPAYEPRSPWNAWAAAGAALLLFVVSLIAAYGAALIVQSIGGGSGPADHAPAASRQGGELAIRMVWMLSAQLILALVTVMAAGAFGGSWREVLAWRPPAQGARAYGEALVLMLLLTGIFNAGLYVAARHAMIADLRPFLELLASPARWVAVPAIGLGAPLSEELLFRGFVLSALAASPLGFRRGALLVTAAWTVLHWGYSIYGMVEVFLVGLYLAWLLWRTGSLWVPLACHTIYNCGLLAVLLTIPLLG